MYHSYWTDWYFGWGWFLWLGVLFLMFSSVGNWRYSYSAHQKHNQLTGKEALDILNERYAQGAITREEYGQIKSDLTK